MKNVRLGVSPITLDIFAGKLNKAETMWTGDKCNVTEEAIRCVFEKMMMESRRDDNKVIEYTYPSFGTLSFTPKEPE